MMDDLNVRTTCITRCKSPVGAAFTKYKPWNCLAQRWDSYHRCGVRMLQMVTFCVMLSHV